VGWFDQLGWVGNALVLVRALHGVVGVWDGVCRGEVVSGIISRWWGELPQVHGWEVSQLMHFAANFSDDSRARVGCVAIAKCGSAEPEYSWLSAVVNSAV